ncbi:MAG: hypothetical protein KJ718_04700 [Nanoarchaeota archaeon]|nr:hypothetical protein [Nanoarchaeota archaeon]MBU1051826.1 hypothetical protein [Nanoarchaeota archaeon]MBU1988443.1 hypothetical protein [Nanoarchaeota archaeon]
MRKEAQAWGFDLIVGFMIFTVAIVTFYFFALNFSGQDEEISQELVFEGKLIGESLLSEGSPKNWDPSDVVIIGILDSEGKINETKLQNFLLLDYDTTKELFNIRHDYYINFSKELNVSGGVSGVGNMDDGSENLAVVRRVSSYNGEPITLSIYLSD